jgi:hypothetical protein
MKMKNNSTTTIGLFGTCGSSKWRDNFVSLYTEFGVNYFNPLVEDWDPSLAEIEAYHLMNDEIILFPVTDETYGVGSLSEIGFSILTSLKRDVNKHVVIYIAPKVDESKLASVDKQALKDSNNARVLVAAHLRANPMANVHIVDSLAEMLNVSTMLYAALEMISLAKHAKQSSRSLYLINSLIQYVILMSDHLKESVVHANEDIEAHKAMIL